MPNRIEASVRSGSLPKLKQEVLLDLVTKLSTSLEAMALDEVRSAILGVGAVASGQLLRSVTAEVSSSSTRNLLIAVGSDDRAALPIEQGLEAGESVTVDRIYEWMIQKNIPDATRWGAYYIARKLFFEGYDARRPFEIAEANIISRVDDIINNVLNSKDF